uniref:Uncharacterized protein n=1 Tax=Tetranychus urticae TaxID=32264 RepID=T1JY22_TETUR
MTEGILMNMNFQLLLLLVIIPICWTQSSSDQQQSPSSLSSSVKPIQNDLTILLTDKPIKSVRKGENQKVKNTDFDEDQSSPSKKGFKRLVSSSSSKGLTDSRFTGIRQTKITDNLSEYKLLHHGHLGGPSEPTQIGFKNSADQGKRTWSSKYQNDSKFRDDSPMNRIHRQNHQLRQYGSSLRKRFNNSRKGQNRWTSSKEQKKKLQADEEDEEEEEEEEVKKKPKKIKVKKQISGNRNSQSS